MTKGLACTFFTQVFFQQIHSRFGTFLRIARRADLSLYMIQVPIDLEPAFGVCEDSIF